MSFEFDFDYAHSILRCTFSGDVDDDELLRYYKKAAEYVALTDPMIGLSDFTNVVHFTVSVETVRKLAKSAPAMPQAARPRVIVAAADRIYGMARIFELEGETTRPNVHVVRTMREAWAILGIAQEPPFIPIDAYVPRPARPKASETKI
jgi:hypothetical protein